MIHISHYIKDGTLRKSTQLAYKYMQKNNNLKKSVDFYSEKYGIDRDLLEKEVKAMQKDEWKANHKRKKVYREKYTEEHTPLSKSEYQSLIKEWKTIGSAAHKNGDEALADLCRRSILAIADLGKGLFGKPYIQTYIVNKEKGEDT